MTFWTVPRLWPGQTIAVFGSGPSMSQAVADAVLAADVPAIAVNDTYKLAPWAAILFSADLTWWRFHMEHVAGFRGLKVCSQPGRPLPGVQRIKLSGDFGFDPDPSCIRFGGNSGYQAVHIGIHTGAAKILLCGFDMHGTHFFGKHPEPLRNPHENRFARWIKRFKDLRDCGAEIINCTPDSALPWFPMMRLEDAL